MMAYVFFGQYLPQPFGHAPYSMKKITSLLYMGTEGIWSSPLAASATFIPLFIMFGCMLEAFGGGAFFMDFSSALFGKYRGGPAKVAVISSGLMGSISGSAVANVTTTGAFTIPLMKKLGYDKDFAGAVEATASTGGQLAPPVMGAGAFLMSEILAVPYATIVKAAIIPALLYYLGCFFVVDFEAGRLGLSGMKKEELPVFKEVMKRAGITFPADHADLYACVCRHLGTQGIVLCGSCHFGDRCDHRDERQGMADEAEGFRDRHGQFLHHGRNGHGLRRFNYRCIRGHRPRHQTLHAHHLFSRWQAVPRVVADRGFCDYSRHGSADSCCIFDSCHSDCRYTC